MTISILLLLFGVLLVAAYALWDLGADDLVAHFARFVVRAVTFGRVRLPSDIDEGTTIAVSMAIVIAIFLCFLVIAARVSA